MSRLRAVITFDDSWDDEAVRNAFVDNDQFIGVVSVEISSAGCGECARQKQNIETEQLKTEILALLNTLQSSYQIDDVKRFSETIIKLRNKVKQNE